MIDCPFSIIQSYYTILFSCSDTQGISSFFYWDVFLGFAQRHVVMHGHATPYGVVVGWWWDTPVDDGLLVATSRLLDAEYSFTQNLTRERDMKYSRVGFDRGMKQALHETPINWGSCKTENNAMPYFHIVSNLLLVLSITRNIHTIWVYLWSVKVKGYPTTEIGQAFMRQQSQQGRNHREEGQCDWISQRQDQVDMDMRMKKKTSKVM